MTTGTRNLDVDPMLALLSMHIEEGNTSGAWTTAACSSAAAWVPCR
jgi:hypothetical protein